ncbi:hypothetical protein E3N88_20314 [Mikania micrantha]|uniref:Uncharacterized protein n=1 Tax=Mikania micrantha TaxID=192012 RepID=A0A5N6NGN2_9ASTR|nr:hypothetical protein E3N88_20314 [Mikania micrantha]
MIEKRARLGQNNKNKLIGPYGWARRYARPGAPKSGVARATEMERLTWLLPRVAGDRDVLLDVQELTLTHYFITKVTEELMDIQRCTIGERALGPSCIPVFA